MDYSKEAEALLDAIHVEIMSHKDNALWRGIVATTAQHIEQAVTSEMRRLGVHLSHCNFGENAGGCKYGDEDCPALQGWDWFGKALDRAAPAAEPRKDG